jgi:pimeloyl-ACP methyl ester carboxylesterase
MTIPVFKLLIGVPLLAGTLLAGETAVADLKFTVIIRGQQQELHYFAATTESSAPAPRILFSPGDGGWRGFAIVMAENLAASGYDVYGLDTRRYLLSFTGKTALKESEVMDDFRVLAQRLGGPKGERITLLGWSEGAGLCLLAAAAPQNRAVFNGLISVGISETSLLAWHWTDSLVSISGLEPKEPAFRSEDYLKQVSPLPVYMIHSTHDDYVTLNAAKKMFAAAADPKRFDMIEAQNHRFDGNQEAFFNSLRKGLQWIRQAAR